MHIWLLTHSEELKKENGTGQLVKQTLPSQCSVIVWQRKLPAKDILALPSHSTILIYPNDNTHDHCQWTGDLTTVEHIILLDGTWQQARKMYNQSPYLQRFLTYEIQGQTSTFQRRRNQLPHGLCTAESVSYLLHQAGQEQSAKRLEQVFLSHNHALPN